MGRKPSEKSLMTGTNKRFADPSGDAWLLASHDGLALTWKYHF